MGARVWGRAGCAGCAGAVWSACGWVGVRPGQGRRGRRGFADRGRLCVVGYACGAVRAVRERCVARGGDRPGQGAAVAHRAQHRVRVQHASCEKVWRVKQRVERRVLCVVWSVERCVLCGAWSSAWSGACFVLCGAWSGACCAARGAARGAARAVRRVEQRVEQRAGCVAKYGARVAGMRCERAMRASERGERGRSWSYT